MYQQAREEGDGGEGGAYGEEDNMAYGEEDEEHSNEVRDVEEDDLEGH